MGKAIRDVYGAALVRYGKADRRVVVLDADVSGSTKSADFGRACPERFLRQKEYNRRQTAYQAACLPRFI